MPLHFSDTSLQQKGTALRVFGFSKDFAAGQEHQGIEGGEAEWKRITTLSIFEKHGWIESSEIIQDKLLVLLPLDQIAVRLDVRIVGRGLEWGARAIVKVWTEDTEERGASVTGL